MQRVYIYYNMYYIDDVTTKQIVVKTQSSKRYCMTNIDSSSHSNDELYTSDTSDTDNEFDDIWKRKYSYLKILAKRSIMV